jgi:transposase
MDEFPGNGTIPREGNSRSERMVEPDDVGVMLALHRRGWGTKRIAESLGCSRGTVKRYIKLGGWAGYGQPRRGKALDGLEDWLSAKFRQHHGNADVVRQELERHHGIRVSLRTVERAVRPLRQVLRAEARATVRFETAPGKQLQIDFGETRTEIGGELVRVYLFVATLGYSRRCYVQAFRHERQSAWLDGIEGAFQHFGGVPEEILLDNARALVTSHDVATREVSFNERLRAFADYWKVVPKACAPYRARTKGKDERGVGYVKRNAMAGHRFASFGALEAHLSWWMREIADQRAHGTTGEPPLARFLRDEAATLRPLNGRPPFRQIRELIRRVQSDCSVEVDTNSYSVPWRLIGETVQVTLAGGRVVIRHAGKIVADHGESGGRRHRIIETLHFEGVVGHGGMVRQQKPPVAPAPSAELLRPLAEYERLIGGSW